MNFVGVFSFVFFLLCFFSLHYLFAASVIASERTKCHIVNAQCFIFGTIKCSDKIEIFSRKSSELVIILAVVEFLDLFAILLSIFKRT